VLLRNTEKVQRKNGTGISAGPHLSSAAVGPAKAMEDNHPAIQIAGGLAVKPSQANREELEHASLESERGYGGIEKKRSILGNVGNEENQNGRRGGRNLENGGISRNQENACKTVGNQGPRYMLNEEPYARHPGKSARENLPRQPFGFTPSAMHGSVPTPSSCNPA